MVLWVYTWWLKWLAILTELIWVISKIMLSGPLSVLLEINSLCQLRCQYCSAAPFNGSQWPLPRAITLIEELGKFPVWALTISGGEPLLYPHLSELIEACFNVGIRPVINTNGLKLLDDKTFEGLVDLKDRGIEFTLSLSLDSAIPEENDFGRGRGLEVVEAIHRASVNGLDLTLSTVVHKGNLHSALKIPEVFDKIRQFRYSAVVVKHLSTNVASRLLACDEDMQNFWHKASQLQQEYSQSRILLPFRVDSQQVPDTHIAKVQGKCFCGFTSCVIDSCFNVYPCDWARTEIVKMGNVENRSLKDVWLSKQSESVRSQAQTKHLCSP